VHLRGQPRKVGRQNRWGQFDQKLTRELLWKF
jgi:hypothetical protein